MQRVGLPRFLLAGVCAALLVCAAHTLYRYLHREQCEMTWMYWWPQYQRINLSAGVEEAFPSYSLHLYKESLHEVDHTLSRPPVLRGIPVLFLPGNAGSHKQVRSSASIALRMSPREFPHLQHFDFFTVNLNEDLSGIFGGVLERQTLYVAVCIRHILSLYHVEPSPQSVVIIAHSMGGLVAHALFTLPDFNHSSVHTIITLASPLKHPVISFDYLLQQFYEKVHKVWSEGGVSSHVTVVSIAGGEMDVQVPTHLTQLDYSINTATAAVPRNWVSADHQAVVWCRRVQLALSRTLFLLQARGGRRELTRDRGEREKILSHYLHRGREVPTTAATAQLKTQGWMLVKDEYFWLDKHESGYSAVYVPHSSWREANKTLLLATNTSQGSWVYACSQANSEKMAHCTDLSGLAALLPPRTGVVKYILLRSDSLPQGTANIVIRSQVPRKKVFVMVEQCSRVEYQLQLSLWGGHMTLPPSDHCTLVNITIPNLRELWQVYSAAISSCPPIRAGLMTPWLPHTPLLSTNHSNQLPLSLSLLVPTPHDATAHLLVWAPHSCQLEINVTPDILGLMSKLLMLYAPLLLPWLAGVSISASSTNIAVEMAVIAVLYPLTSEGWLPGTDWQALSADRLWCGWVPPTLHLTALTLHRLLLATTTAAVGFIQRRVGEWRLRRASCILIGASLPMMFVCSGAGLLCVVLAYALRVDSPGGHWLLCVLLSQQFLTLPSLLSWLRGIWYALTLFPDPHFWPVLGTSAVVMATLLLTPANKGSRSPNAHPPAYTWLIGLFHLTTACLLLLYSITHAYRIAYFILTHITVSALKEFVISDL